MASVDRSLVAALPMFAGLTPVEQEELLREARSVRYPKDTAVFDQGADADRFFVLLHGHLRVEKTSPQGQQTVVRYVSARGIVRRRAGDEPQALPGDRGRCGRQHCPRLAIVLLVSSSRPISEPSQQRAANRGQPVAGHTGQDHGDLERAS